ncbi:hypothetical protein C8N35_102110 [Breoghania corrubedonensis]|uniref:Zinc-ribbon domain-containing protein n=1 Tax=Breoghania corrubedonensis TaxID=665038 RepID=A0A2T5VCB7_9HYPH|nr:hypothetical protein [Breoghania corrubedonensis]PTW61401.1 hypothetical protein C8N35_102110 [Breoghania corrubedonensis]
MGARQQDLFGKPARGKRRWRAHVIDAGINPCIGPQHIAKFSCQRCQWASDWEAFETIGAIKRGIPCPKCNVGGGA